MAKVLAKVIGGKVVELDGVTNVDSVISAMGLDGKFTMLVNGTPVETNHVLATGDFVSLTRAVKGNASKIKKIIRKLAKKPIKKVAKKKVKKVTKKVTKKTVKKAVKRTAGESASTNNNQLYKILVRNDVAIVKVNGEFRINGNVMTVTEMTLLRDNITSALN